MTDLQIAADPGRRASSASAGYLALCDRVAAMNAIELLAGLAAAFCFVYLLWALLRPEDF